MSLVTISLDESRAADVRDIVRQLIDGVMEAGSVSVRLPESLPVQINRQGDHVAVEWEGVEVDLPGPINPDLLRARLYDDHAVIDLRLSSIRVHY